MKKPIALPGVILFLLITTISLSGFAVSETVQPDATLPFDRFISNECIIALYLPQSAQLDNKIKETPLGELWQDPNARPWRDAVVAELNSLAGTWFDPFPVFKNSIDTVLMMGLPRASQPGAFPTPWFSAVIRVKDGKKDEVNQYITSALDSIAKRQSEQIACKTMKIGDFDAIEILYQGKSMGGVVFFQDYVIVASNINVLETSVTQEQANALWKTSFHKSFTYQDDIYLWLNYPLLLSRVLDNSQITPEQRFQVDTVLNILGLNQINYIYLTMQMKKGEILSRLVFVFPDQRAGLFSLFKTVETLPILNTVDFPEYSHGAVSFIAPLENLQLARQRARDLAGDQAVQQINMSLAMIQLMTGINIEQDILALFGSHAAFVSRGITGSAVVLELNDPLKFDAVIKTISLRFQLGRLDFTHEGMSYFQLRGSRSKSPIYIGRGEKHVVFSSNHLLLRKTLKRILEVEKMTLEALNAGIPRMPDMVAVMYSPVEDVSFMSTVGDFIVGSINRQLRTKGMRIINPMLVPDYVIMMDHAFPNETFVLASTDTFEIRSRSAYGLGGEALMSLPALMAIVKNASALSFREATGIQLPSTPQMIPLE